ncbi:NAD(P)-dependent oxidoreductase [Sulfitobacter sp. HNIBRBA3233]|uniref:NAD(P)-dependent oxidoreductase n=1 Tax=Sulfitobacter marinivivus TaxID=3158558 RepID=UPI0032E04E5A
MASLGFVGTGTMGAPMVHCLVEKGFTPMVFDSVPEAAEKVAARDGLKAVASLAELAGGCDTVILMLPTSAIVREVCLGEGGLVGHLRPGAVIIDMSSSDPIETRSLGKELAERDVILLDAPVSGGLRKAVAGTLAIMLGGDDAAAMDAAEPVLQAMGRVFRAGPLGAGHATKALNNYVSAAGLVAACEAVIMAKDFGLDPERMTEIINASTGRNNSTENKIVQFVLSEQFRDAGFALSLMTKDVALAAGLAQQSGRPMPGVAAVSSIWNDADRVLGQRADHTEIFRYLDGLE